MLPALALYGSLLVATPPVEPAPSAPARREPRWRGVGLSVAAGVTGAVGLAVNSARIGVVQRACSGLGAGPGPDREQAITACIHDSQEYFALSALAPLASASAVGLAAGAGVISGRYRAAHDHRRRGTASAFVGAGLFGVSAVAFAIAQTGMWRDLYGARSCLAEASLSSDCVRARWSGWLGAVSVSQAGAVVGAGLFAFGVSRRIYHARQRRQTDLSLQPALSLTFAGIRLSGRF